MNDLSSRLREAMAELKIESAADLAKFCKVSEGLVSQWFAGTTGLGPKPLKAFSRTQFSLDWLSDGRLPKYRPGGVEAGPTLHLVADADNRIDPDDLRMWMNFFIDVDTSRRKKLISTVQSLVGRFATLDQREKL